MNSIGPDRLSFLDGAVEQNFDDESVASKEARGWGENNSSFEDYCMDVFIPPELEHGGLRDVVYDYVGFHEGNVGMDIAGGSNGVALQDLLHDGILGQAILTNYTDRRSKTTEEEQRLHHINGDLVNRATWEQMLSKQEELAPDGLALIMHRPVGGLQNLQPYVYKGAAQLLLNMTRLGGVVFCQVPKSLTRPSREHYLETVCPSIRRRQDIEVVLPSYVHRFDRSKILDSVVIVKKR